MIVMIGSEREGVSDDKWLYSMMLMMIARSINEWNKAKKPN